MKLEFSKRTLIVTLMVLVYCVAAWFIARNHYLDRANTLIRQESRLAQLRVQDLAGGIRQNLNYLSGIPAFYSNTIRVNKALNKFGPDVRASKLPYEIRKAQWSNDPLLKDLSGLLAVGHKNLGADLIYVVNAAGDCIAASNADSAGSPIGTNFSERELFKQNQIGQGGMQYAMGKTTHIAGLYFSSPVFSGNKFMGAVVTKVDVPSLYFLVKYTDAYIADDNGVVILAQNKLMEMHALPDATIQRLSKAEVQALYQREDIPRMHYADWQDDDFPALHIYEGEKSPHIHASEALPEYGLTAFVESDIASLQDIKRDRIWFDALVTLLGAGFIIALSSAITYLQSIRRTRNILMESERRLNESQHTAKLGSWELDLVSGQLVWSDEVYNIFEIERTEFGASYPAFLEAIHPDDRDLVSASYDQHLKDRKPYQIEHRLKMADGRLKYVIEKCHSEFDAYGKPIRSIGTVQDVTGAKQIEESQRLAALIYQSSAEAVMITDDQNLIVDVNPAFTTLTGYTLEEVAGKSPSLLKSGRHDKAFYVEMWQSLLQHDAWQGEIWDQRKDGHQYVKFASLGVIRNPDGTVYRYVAQFFDITERKRQEELIWAQANYDTLTELPNRRLFLDRLGQETKKAHRAGHSLALLFLDLDRFKEVNDTLGHARGDLLLQQAAARISKCVRETDTVARLGGDEFTLILPDFGERVHLERIAQDIIRELTQPFDLGGGDMAYISASIGITLYPDDAEDIDSLMKQADQAMYTAKAEGRNRFSYFTKRMQLEAHDKLALTNDLRNALTKNELEVYYQPIMDMKTGELRKAEALLRWKHPERGMVSPVTFIPLAEESGLIVEIGNWVFTQALLSIDHWEREYGRHVQVSVNMSPVQFEHAMSNEWIERLTGSETAASKITVEITEGLLIKDSDKVKQKLLKFRNKGIEVSIDDFGTGFSALSYLKQFDIDYLKIDRAFVSNLTEDESDKALTEAIIVMAHKLGIQTIAEGVETEAQRDLLVSFGCDYVQGYLYSKPVPAAEFVKLLAK